MPFQFQLTDDQFALLGCLLAVAGSMLLMSFSYRSNPALQKNNNQQQGTAPVLAARQDRRAA